MSDRREHPHIPVLKEQLVERKVDRREFLRTATLLGMSAGAAYSFAGKVTGQAFMPAAQAAHHKMPKGGVVRIGMGVQEVKHPHAYNWVYPANISTQVVGRLAVINQDNIAEPWLCERWEASDDLKTWDFHLRDMKWHNGRQFTADDVIWNLKHILDPATGSSSIGLMKGYMLEEYDTGKKDEDGNAVMSTRLWDANAIEKVDDKTVRLNLKVPQLAIPEHLDAYTNVILDPEENGEFKVGSNGLGAFTLAEHAVGIKAVLEARKEPFFRGGPHIDRLEFLDVGEDPSANVAALASKQVHGLYQVDTAQYEIIKRLPHVEVHQVATAATAVVQMIIDREPFDKREVRLAMRYGMDAKEVLRLAQRDLGLPAEHHFVCPIHPDYAELPEMTRDPAKARKLLADAGYPDGVKFTFNVKKDPAWELAAVQAMAAQWKEAGIDADINVMPQAQFWDVWDKFDCGFVEWAHRPLGFMVLSLGFRTGVPWNPTMFADQEFDDLLTKAEGTLDLEERRAIMKKIEIIMQERGPICQPVWRSILTGMDKRVKGYRMHPQYHFRGNELAIES